MGKQIWSDESVTKPSNKISSESFSPKLSALPRHDSSAHDSASSTFGDSTVPSQRLTSMVFSSKTRYSEPPILRTKYASRQRV